MNVDIVGFHSILRLRWFVRSGIPLKHDRLLINVHLKTRGCLKSIFILTYEEDFCKIDWWTFGFFCVNKISQQRSVSKYFLGTTPKIVAYRYVTFGRADIFFAVVSNMTTWMSHLHHIFPDNDSRTPKRSEPTNIVLSDTGATRGGYAYSTPMQSSLRASNEIQARVPGNRLVGNIIRNIQ